VQFQVRRNCKQQLASAIPGQPKSSAHYHASSVLLIRLPCAAAVNDTGLPSSEHSRVHMHQVRCIENSEHCSFEGPSAQQDNVTVAEQPPQHACMPLGLRLVSLRLCAVTYIVMWDCPSCPICGPRCKEALPQADDVSTQLPHASHMPACPVLSVTTLKDEVCAWQCVTVPLITR
jgi:hypothetical protein